MALDYFSLLASVVVLTIFIAKACDKFEIASDFLGRNMAAGVKGATVNAAGSSMPELLTISALLIIGIPGAFAAGVSVTAGSAIFNSAVIPIFVIMAVMAPHLMRLIVRVGTVGFIIIKEGPAALTEIKLNRSAIARDMIALLIAEIALVFILGESILYWYHGFILICLYIPYLVFMWWQTKNHEAPEYNLDDYEVKDNKTAYKLLIIAIAVLCFACYLLGEAIFESAVLFGVNPIITALFLGAAVSSVPDTILSVKDALKGNYEDALGNALGSNTFDICAALGIPLFFYTLIAGPVIMPEHEAIQALRIGLIVFTIFIAAIFLIPKFLKLWQAKVLAVAYIFWLVFALNTEFHWF